MKSILPLSPLLLALAACASDSNPPATSANPDPDIVAGTVLPTRIAVTSQPDTKPPAPPPPSLLAGEADWSRSLSDLLPVLKSCMARTPAQPAVVLKAWPTNKGMAGAWTRGADGQRWACVAPLSGAAVDLFEPLRRTENYDPKREPVFSTGPEQGRPSGECYEHEPVKDSAGQTVGWLSYDLC
ncbi:MAG TPA: hypothetical protein VNN09_02790 [Candidatus Competibacteraceae bacterium]|nr:hypothetical protein [Candidatus Competibacteraceae bacterium]